MIGYQSGWILHTLINIQRRCLHWGEGVGDRCYCTEYETLYTVYHTHLASDWSVYTVLYTPVRQGPWCHALLLTTCAYRPIGCVGGQTGFWLHGAWAFKLIALGSFSLSFGLSPCLTYPSLYLLFLSFFFSLYMFFFFSFILAGLFFTYFSLLFPFYLMSDFFFLSLYAIRIRVSKILEPDRCFLFFLSVVDLSAVFFHFDCISKCI